MPDSEIVVLSMEAREALREIYENSKRHCADNYLELLKSMSKLPESQLVDGALSLAREKAAGQDVGSAYGNHWLQALSIQNPVSALLVSEMIERILS